MPTTAIPVLDHAGRYRAQGACPLHAHRGCELLAVRSGRCTVEIEGGPDQEAGPGCVLLLPPRCAHRHRDHGVVATAYAVFRLPPGAPPERLRRLQVAAGDPLLAWLDQVIDAHRAGGDPDPRLTGGLLLAILARLDRLDPPPAAAPDPLAAAERHLEEHLADPLRIASLARLCGLSPGHLGALFRARHGCPPGAWQRRRRLALAERLLRDPRLSVAQVAAACGWRDANLFGRLFRAAHGQPPGRWRHGVDPA